MLKLSCFFACLYLIPWVFSFLLSWSSPQSYLQGSRWVAGWGISLLPSFLFWKWVVLHKGAPSQPISAAFHLPTWKSPLYLFIRSQSDFWFETKEFELTKFIANFALLRFTQLGPRLHAIVGKGRASTISIIHVFGCVRYILSWIFFILLIILISLCSIWWGKVINHVVICLVLCCIQWKNISLWYCFSLSHFRDQCL